MLQTNFTNIRDIQRNYKKVAEEVNKTNMPVVVMSKNQPQFAIVSLQTLEELEPKKPANSVEGLKTLAQWVKDNQVNLPADLGEKHNEYAWDE